MRKFGCVIIGAGTDCVLANRLSTDPTVSVCMNEAGPSDWVPLIDMPGAFGAFMFDKKHDWFDRAKPDPRVFGGKPLLGYDDPLMYGTPDRLRIGAVLS